MKKTYTAKKVHPVLSNPIKNGAVVTEKEKIVAVGSQTEILSKYRSKIFDFGEKEIIPAFVNAHTHLELDQFAGRVKIPLDFASWIEKASMILMDEFGPNFESNINPTEILRNGICVVGDISSVGASPEVLDTIGVWARVFHEGFDLLPENTETSFAKIQNQKNHATTTQRLVNHLAPHTPFSATPDLFRKIRKNENFISLHLAESPSEKYFLRDGSGPLREMKLRFGSLTSDWHPPGVSPVRYFFENDFATGWNLLVHMVQIENSDWEILEQNKNKIAICLCPISNKNLKCGIAPGREFLDRGFTVALGTDSAMSGGSLDMIAVINAAVKDYEFSFDEALFCATLGGAKALKFDDRIGSIEIGKDAQLLAYDGISIDWIEGVGV